jgi:hypothetical protein
MFFSFKFDDIVHKTFLIIFIYIEKNKLRLGFFMVTLALHFFVRGQCRRIGLPFYGRAPLFVFVLISLGFPGRVSPLVFEFP